MESRLVARKQVSKQSPPDRPDADAVHLLHELEVHRIELETQNEELLGARRETEAGLQRYSELFEFAPIGYATLTPEGAIFEINHAGALMLGRARSNLIGSLFRMYLAEASRSGFDAMLARVAAGGDKESCEVVLQTRDHTVPHARLTAALLTTGKPVILLAFEDITELASKELALREAAQRKDEFLAVLSHELRNPLAPIRISLAVLSHANVTGEHARKAREIIDRQVTHMTRLIDDLLDVNRIAQGKIRLQRSRVDLGELVRRTLEDYRPSFELSGIALREKIDQGQFAMNADAARLIQALSNLLGNAEKFTPRGGAVEVRLQRVGESVILSVEDTGIGIDKDLLKHVFEPFVQAPQTMDRSRGGLGLGLAMVKGIVELHHGHVLLNSGGLNQGTQVTIVLPLDFTVAEVIAPPAPARVSQARRILVIDDNADTVDSMRDALQLEGHQVQIAYDGERGLALARSFHPEVVLCDLGLPGMDGYAVAQAFRAERDFEPVYLIAVSGYRRPEDVERALHAGFNAHLAKPPRLEDLERTVAEAGLLLNSRVTARTDRSAPLH